MQTATDIAMSFSDAFDVRLDINTRFKLIAALLRISRRLKTDHLLKLWQNLDSKVYTVLPKFGVA